MSRLFLAVLLTVLGGCYGPAAVSGQGGRCSANAEALAGARAAWVLEARFGGAWRDARAERDMEHVARPLVEGNPELQGRYRFRLLDSDQVNAFSLPGGYIYLTRGLYSRLTSEELLAAVLAHEMAHLAARDHFKPRPQGTEAALAKELSADAKAASYLRAGGYRSSALVDLVHLISDAQPPGWADARVANLSRCPNHSH